MTIELERESLQELDFLEPWLPVVTEGGTVAVQPTLDTVELPVSGYADPYTSYPYRSSFCNCSPSRGEYLIPVEEGRDDLCKIAMIIGAAVVLTLIACILIVSIVAP